MLFMCAAVHTCDCVLNASYAISTSMVHSTHDISPCPAAEYVWWASLHAGIARFTWMVEGAPACAFACARGITAQPRMLPLLRASSILSQVQEGCRLAVSDVNIYTSSCAGACASAARHSHGAPWRKRGECLQPQQHQCSVNSGTLSQQVSRCVEPVVKRGRMLLNTLLIARSIPGLLQHGMCGIWNSRLPKCRSAHYCS